MSLALVCSALFCSVALSAPIKVELEEDSQGLHYRISARATGGKVKRADVKLSLTDDKEPLHSIEIRGASAKKEWLKSFTESKSHPYIKGILVRERSGGSVQVRTRFKASPRLPKGYGAMVTVEQDGDAVHVTLKSPIKASSEREPPRDREVTQAESDQREVQKIRRITATYQDEPVKALRPVSPSAAPSPSAATERVKDSSTLSRGAEPTPIPPPFSRTTGSSIKRSQNPTAPLPVTSSTSAQPAAGTTETSKSGASFTAPDLVQPSSPIMNQAEFSSASTQSSSTAQETSSKGSQDQAQKGSNGSNDNKSNEGFEWDLDRQILIVAAVFVLALLGLYLMRRSGKSGFGAQGEIPFKIRSRQLVNAQWNQELLIVDVLDRTLLLGSSASGGLSLLAQISPDPNVRPEPQPRYQDYGAYPESDDYPSERYSRDYQDERYQDEPSFHEGGYDAPEYYPDQHASPQLDAGHHPQQHEPSLDERDSSYTLEVPMAQMDAIPAQVTADLTAERAAPTGGFNASTALGGLEALVSEAQSRSSSSAQASRDPEPSSVSADDLLQKIRQLNQG